MADPFVRIQGAGPVGILTALFLEKYGWDQAAIALVDPAIAAPLPPHEQDPRILALSHGTLVRFQQLGIDLPITRIKRIHVSSQGHFGSMEIRTDRVGVSDLGGLVSYASLLTTLREKISSIGIPIVADAASIQTAPDVCVIAEGGVYQPGIAPADPMMTIVRDYQQSAVLGWVTTNPAPSDTAWERFTNDGVVAMLPIGQRYALVFCKANDQAQAFHDADQNTRIRQLSDIMGGRVLGIEHIDVTGIYPLGLKWRDVLAQDHTVWIGNSAQALHPVAGQGLNLGFRDAETLAMCLMQRGQPIPARLKDYARRRKTDRWAVRSATDTLARQSWVRAAIGGVALVPGAKKLLGQVLMYGG
jgi:2-octaprenyl-6-methoxyphenol hydroxylase